MTDEPRLTEEEHAEALNQTHYGLAVKLKRAQGDVDRLRYLLNRQRPLLEESLATGRDLRAEVERLKALRGTQAALHSASVRLHMAEEKRLREALTTIRDEDGEDSCYCGAMWLKDATCGWCIAVAALASQVLVRRSTDAEVRLVAANSPAFNPGKAGAPTDSDKRQHGWGCNESCCTVSDEPEGGRAMTRGEQFIIAFTIFLVFAFGYAVRGCVDDFPWTIAIVEADDD